MSIDKVLQATLLLTVFFNKREVGVVSPLSPLEYGRLAAWLHHLGLSPADLLSDTSELLAAWVDPKKKITIERINELLARGASMGFALEGWYKQGVWILSRSSNEYPRSIRKHLGDARPPILFGVGNKSLLNQRGIGFVGSRSIDDSDALFTKRLACQVVDQGYIVVSGGASGTDQIAMEAALSHGGMSVGVLADSLLKASTKRVYREAIESQRLALVSPYYPEAGFSTGNAMGRNKYIYTLSEAVVAVRSDLEKGGTWAGAVECQKKLWVPLLVRDSEHQGNQELIKRGALPISDDCNDIQAFLAANLLTDAAQDLERLEPTASPTEKGELGSTGTDSLHADLSGTAFEYMHSRLMGTPLAHYGELFSVFLRVLTEVVQKDRNVTPDSLQEIFPELPLATIKKWLADLTEHNFLIREGRKLSYMLPAPDLFQ